MNEKEDLIVKFRNQDQKNRDQISNLELELQFGDFSQYSTLYDGKKITYKERYFGLFKKLMNLYSKWTDKCGIFSINYKGTLKKRTLSA